MNATNGAAAARDGQLRVLYACLFTVMVGYGSTLIVLPYHTQRVRSPPGTRIRSQTGCQPSDVRACSDHARRPPARPVEDSNVLRHRPHRLPTRRG